MMNTAHKSTRTLLVSAIALLCASASLAQTFNVDLNTANLSEDAANAPFYLDFQLNYGGSTEPSNTVTLSNFQFTGGAALGSATTKGTASGSLSNTVSLTANSTSAFNEFFQQFAAGTTDITFTATVSKNGSGVTPTEFSASILDNSLGFPAQIFTTAPDTASLVALDLNASNTLSNVGAYTSLSSADGNTAITAVTATISPIPEPSTTAAIFGGTAALLALCLRRSGKRNPTELESFSTIGR